jgi:hypothetical protein
VSPSEIAFLALGIVLGAAIGAAIVEAVRSRPAPRREVRVTISPNSVLPRRGATLAAAVAGASARRMPGSPEDEAWRGGPAASFLAAASLGRRSSGMAILDRTRVLSGPPVVPSTAVAVPVDRSDRRDAAPADAAPTGAASPGPADGQAGGGTPARPIAPAPGAGKPGAGTSTAGAVPAPPVRPRPPEPPDAPRPEVRPGPWPDQGAPSASRGGALGAIAVLEALAAAEDAQAGRTATPGTEQLRGRSPVGVVDIGAPVPEATVKPRAPTDLAPIVIAPAAVGLATVAEGATGSHGQVEGRQADGDGGDAGSAGPGAMAPGSEPGIGPCAAIRVRVEERCSVASTAADQAQTAADALREAQRAYDTLRERVERAQADADPRALAAGKDALHIQFRAATRKARGAEDTEAAAREWLTQINDLNVKVRDAQRLADAGAAELRGALPRLERMEVEADAARISAEHATAACQDAREQLAVCEEADATRRVAAAAGSDPSVEAAGATAAAVDEDAEIDGSFERQVPSTQAAIAGMPVIVKLLRGDRTARDRLIATLAAGEPDGERLWTARIAQLVGAITARAIEDGYLDMPEDDTFWSLFTARESREIVGALSALGYRYDGAGGFADERVPAQRDLSLAVGYAGLDRMRIRNWPRERELSELYQRANVAADEWLVEHTDDLTLGQMVEALGPRAGDLAEVWNAWGRVRPALLAPD